MNFRVIKEEAKDALFGNRFMVFLAILVASGIQYAASILLRDTPYLSLIATYLFIPLSGGLFLVCKNVIKKGEVNINLLFDCYKDLNHALKLIGVAILTGIIVFVGIILLVIPGIIFAYQYSQAINVMAENPEMGVWEAMTKSKELMIGYKFDYFVFGLSFIGHIILIIITFGLYGIYIIPYIQTAMANYYLHLKGEPVENTTDSDRLVGDYEY